VRSAALRPDPPSEQNQATIFVKVRPTKPARQRVNGAAPWTMLIAPDRTATGALPSCSRALRISIGMTAGSRTWLAVFMAACQPHPDRPHPLTPPSRALCCNATTNRFRTGLNWRSLDRSQRRSQHRCSERTRARRRRPT
jgi:hypothetical protein